MSGDMDLPGRVLRASPRSVECFPWPAAPPCHGGLVLVRIHFLAQSDVSRQGSQSLGSLKVKKYVNNFDQTHIFPTAVFGLRRPHAPRGWF